MSHQVAPRFTLTAKLFLLLSLLGFYFSFLIAQENTASPLSLGTPGHPTVGVYRDVGKKGTAGNDQFAQWLGVKVLLGQDSMPTVATWEHLRGEDWLLSPWTEWKNKSLGRRFVLSVSMLPGPRSLAGPKVGTDANKPVTWEAAARGDYNIYFKVLSSNLINAKLEDSILRIGWEMNGNWYTWRATKHEEAYAAYWRQIVTSIRSVPGSERIQFTFNPDADPGSCQIEKAWPGEEFVDYIGVDIYDSSWIPDTYPYPDDASEQEILTRQKLAWEKVLFPRLKRWGEFARAHHKPLCFPEWGLCARPVNGHGGGDNPYFIEKMYEFIMDTNNQVVAHSYFDCSVSGDANTDHRICPDENGFTRFPRAAEKFKTLFGAK
jgi:hypothetical protein